MNSDTRHQWHDLPSRFVARKWCIRCGCLAEGDKVWAKKFPPWKWDWQYTMPGDPKPTIHRNLEPPCPGGRNA